MKRKQINHGNLNQKTIWLVMDFSKSGCQLNFDYRPLYYKIHFTGFSLSPQKDDDICMIDVFNLIIQLMPKMQTDPEVAFNLKWRQIPYIVKVQQSLYTTLHTGIDQFYKLVETYLTSHLDHQQQYLKGMDQNFRELDPIRIAIRTDIIKDINQKSEISNNNNDFMNNLKVDNSVRNAVCYLLSLNCLYKGQVEFKAQWQMVEENQKWKEFLLSLNENKNHIYELILNFQDSMNKELSYTFKFEVKVPIQDIKQWIKQKMFKLIFHSQIKSQYLNSSQQFNTFILQGQKINYTLINQQILQEYANLHEKAFIKYIEELIEELE